MEKRLFLALPLSTACREAIGLLRFPPARRVRRVPSEELHLTLHFLGSVEVGPVEQALRPLFSPPPRVGALMPQSFGTFRSADGGLILWLGITATPELIHLHRTLGEALGTLGIPLDRRPFTPHVTLARYRPPVNHRVIEDWVENQAPRLPNTYSTELLLYSSVLKPSGPVYSVEQRYPLNA